MVGGGRCFSSNGQCGDGVRKVVDGGRLRRDGVEKVRGKVYVFHSSKIEKARCGRKERTKGAMGV